MFREDALEQLDHFREIAFGQLAHCYHPTMVGKQLRNPVAGPPGQPWSDRTMLARARRGRWDATVSHYMRTTMQSTDRLVILGSGITALAVARDARRLGLQALLVDTGTGVAMASRRARSQVLRGPMEEIALPWLAALGRERRSLLIATSDDWLRFLLPHRSELESSYAGVLHPANTALATCLDKQRFAAWCGRHALRTPRQFQLADLLQSAALPCPLLLRPAETRHAALPGEVCKAREVTTCAALLHEVERLGRAGLQPVLTESLLGRPLRQYSVGFARQDGQTLVVVAQKLRPLPAACATGTLVQTVADTGLEALGRQVAQLLDYRGIGEIEVLRDLDTGEDFLIEVNARPWLQFALGQATGRDLLGLASGAHHGPARAARRQARWLDLRADLRTCFAQPHGLVRNGQLGLPAWFASVARARLFACWSPLDQGPFWHEVRDLFSRLWRPGAAGPGRIRAGGSAAAHRWPASPRPAADLKNSSGWE
jgi:predicted ATP-grasp superfamily ATP-dependent carboligase